MKRPFPAYKGEDSYVFVCYAHSDADTVYADLVALDECGINIWYDEGIPAGSSWRGEIAAAIKGAEKLVYFISEASLKSNHCLREVDFAINNDVEIVPVYLDESTLPGELELVLNRVHGLFRENDSMYMEHLVDAMTGHRGIAALRPGTGKRKTPLWAPILALGLCLALLFAWFQANEDGRAGTADAPSASTGPTAYDLYLEGLGLLERWDKDDNLEVAIGLFHEATQLDPGFALAFARQADGLRIRYALSGDEQFLEQAMQSINEAVRLAPDLGPVQVALGRLHATQGNYDLATAALNRALAIDPNDALANQAIASVYTRLGRTEDAEASHKKAIALDPENPTIHDSYANFLADQSRTEEAVAVWQTVIRLAPDNYAALVNMGSMLTELGRLPEAITVTQRANEIRPSYMAYSNLGTAYARSVRYEDAIQAYQKALEIDDSDWLAWGNMAYVYSWMDGMEEETERTFEKAIELAEAAKAQDSRDPYIFSDLSLYYAKTGNAELALQNQETAVTLAPDTGEILAAAAEASETLGRRDDALKFVRRSLDSGYPMKTLQRNEELADLLQDPSIRSHP